MIRNHIKVPEPDTYEGPHFQKCLCGTEPPHYLLVDELDAPICESPLYDKSMLRRAIEKYGALWNSCIHRYLKREVAWITDIPETIPGSETIDIDAPAETQELQTMGVFISQQTGIPLEAIDLFIREEELSPFEKIVMRGDIFVSPNTPQ